MRLVIIGVLTALVAGCGDLRTPTAPGWRPVPLVQETDDCAGIAEPRYVKRDGRLYVIDCGR